VEMSTGGRKTCSVRELSTTVNISMISTQHIIRLNYLSHKVVKDTVNGG
jgi:hypothetical protein